MKDELISFLFNDEIKPDGPGARTIISNGEFIAICLLTQGPTPVKELKQLLGKWRTTSSGEYTGNEAYFAPSRSGLGSWGPKNIKWCARQNDENCYWWSMRAKNDKTKHPYLVLTEQGLRLARGGLKKIKNVLQRSDDEVR